MIGKWKELLVKVAMLIHLVLEDQHSNRGMGLDYLLVGSPSQECAFKSMPIFIAMTEVDNGAYPPHYSF